MGLREFVATFGWQEATVAVVDREAERPVYRLLVDLFDTDAVAVRDVEADSGPHPTNTTVLRKADTHDDIAVSSLDAVRDELFLVNSDIYVTGARDLCDVDLPEVVAGLDGVPFRVSDRARQPKGKLVLIEMSRAIEAMAWRDGTGRLDAGFQHLSPTNGGRSASTSGSVSTPTSKPACTASRATTSRSHRWLSVPRTRGSYDGRGSWCTDPGATPATGRRW